MGLNKPVDFTTAKLLKEKGIIFETKLYYSSETKVTSVSYNEFAAPTIADVVMRLYEKHDVWVSVQRDWDVGKCLGFEGIIDDNDGSINTETFNSPTEAYEAAIEYTLNNLI